MFDLILRGGRVIDLNSGGGAKDRESARLAALVPEPSVRGAPLPGGVPDVLADVAAVGSDLTWLPMTAAGVTLVVGDVAVSGS